MSNNGSRPATTRIQEGYQPRDQRGYQPTVAPAPPRPPKGGTAVVNSPTANPVVSPVARTPGR